MAKKKTTKAQKDAALERLRRAIGVFQRAMQAALDAGVSHARVTSFTMKVAMAITKDKP